MIECSQCDLILINQAALDYHLAGAHPKDDNENYTNVVNKAGNRRQGKLSEYLHSITNNETEFENLNKELINSGAWLEIHCNGSTANFQTYLSNTSLTPEQITEIILLY